LLNDFELAIILSGKGRVKFLLHDNYIKGIIPTIGGWSPASWKL